LDVTPCEIGRDASREDDSEMALLKHPAIRDDTMYYVSTGIRELQDGQKKKAHSQSPFIGPVWIRHY
jgi:hypothetical protein